jgi:sec-independent protein translocase protein TatB
MFDVGFWEVIFIAVIALLVVGPERLPRIARTTGLWVGKMRGFVSSVKADIDREIATEELKKTLAKQSALPEMEELIDDITGEPLKAGERTVQDSSDKQQSAIEAGKTVSDLTANDKQ